MFRFWFEPNWILFLGVYLVSVWIEPEFWFWLLLWLHLTFGSAIRSWFEPDWVLFLEVGPVSVWIKLEFWLYFFSGWIFWFQLCPKSLCREPYPQALAEANGTHQHLSLRLMYPCVSFIHQL